MKAEWQTFSINFNISSNLHFYKTLLKKIVQSFKNLIALKKLLKRLQNGFHEFNILLK